MEYHHLDPRAVASALITDGTFRFSRNPSYVALTLFYLGIGLLLRNRWILLLSIPVLAAMSLWLIPKEENRLEVKFGEEYRRYWAKVRRWL